MTTVGRGEAWRPVPAGPNATQGSVHTDPAGSSEFEERVGGLISQHASIMLGEPLLPLAVVPGGAGGSVLIALDAQGRQVVVKVVEHLDLAALMQAIQTAGRLGFRSRSSMSQSFRGGAAAFDAATERFYTQRPDLAATVGQLMSRPRLVIVCATTTSDAGDALRFLGTEGGGVEIFPLTADVVGRVIAQVRAQQAATAETSGKAATESRAERHSPEPVSPDDEVPVGGVTAGGPSANQQLPVPRATHPAPAAAAPTAVDPSASPPTSPPVGTRDAFDGSVGRPPAQEPRATSAPPHTLAAAAAEKPAAADNAQPPAPRVAKPRPAPMTETPAQSEHSAQTGHVLHPEHAGHTEHAAHAGHSLHTDHAAEHHATHASASATPARGRPFRQNEPLAVTTEIPIIDPKSRRALPRTVLPRPVAGADRPPARPLAVRTIALEAAVTGRSVEDIVLPTLKKSAGRDIAVLCAELESAVPLVWRRHGTSERWDATLDPSGVIITRAGTTFTDPTRAARAASGALNVTDGWNLWRIGENGPTLAEAWAEVFGTD